MKLTFKKEFDGDLSKLPTRTVEGAVAFKEPETIEKLSLVSNSIALVLAVALLALVVVISGGLGKLFENEFALLFNMLIVIVLSIAILPAHEFLHAICFKEEVEFYTYLRKGLLFVVGTESMTKARFVFMSMLPNLVFGFLPFVLFLIFPSQLWLGLCGAMNIGSGAGDYLNVFNALTQMPKGSLCFMSGNRSYWYIP